MTGMKWQEAAFILAAILISGGIITYSDLFGVLFDLKGINATFTGDQICGEECESYINVTTSYWRVCFAHYEDTKYEDETLFKKVSRSRTLHVNLNNVANIISTAPDVPVDWLVPARGKGNWRPIKDGDCWDRGKVNRIKLVGHKNKYQSVKWSFKTGDYVDIDPLWGGEVDITYTEDTRTTFNGISYNTVFYGDNHFAQNSSNDWVESGKIFRTTRKSDDITYHYEGNKGYKNLTFELGATLNNGDYYSMYDAFTSPAGAGLGFNFPSQRQETRIKYALNITNVSASLQTNVDCITLTYKDHNGFALNQLTSDNKQFRVKGAMLLGFRDLIDSGNTLSINKSERRLYICNLTYTDNDLFLDPYLELSSTAGGTASVYTSAEGSWELSRDPIGEYTSLKTLDIRSDSITPSYFSVFRVFVPVNTSIIPNGVSITKAEYCFNFSTIEIEDDDDEAFIVAVGPTTQVSPEAIEVADFGTCGTLNNPNEYSTRLNLNDITANEITCIELNLGGRNIINKSGYSLFCFREGHDVLNITIADSTNNVASHSVTNSGLPFFNITYKLPIEHTVTLHEPTVAANFTLHNFSVFTVNVTCTDVLDCGDISVTLDPITPTYAFNFSTGVINRSHISVFESATALVYLPLLGYLNQDGGSGTRSEIFENFTRNNTQFNMEWINIGARWSNVSLYTDIVDFFWDGGSSANPTGRYTRGLNQTTSGMITANSNAVIVDMEWCNESDGWAGTDAEFFNVTGPVFNTTNGLALGENTMLTSFKDFRGCGPNVSVNNDSWAVRNSATTEYGYICIEPGTILGDFGEIQSRWCQFPSEEVAGDMDWTELTKNLSLDMMEWVTANKYDTFGEYLTPIIYNDSCGLSCNQANISSNISIRGTPGITIEVGRSQDNITWTWTDPFTLADGFSNINITIPMGSYYSRLRYRMYRTWYNSSVLFEAGGSYFLENATLPKGIILDIPGSIPFWVNTSNPVTINLNASDSQLVTWLVNTTGTIGDTWEFFAMTQTVTNPDSTNVSDRVNITIIEAEVEAEPTPDINLSFGPTGTSIFRFTNCGPKIVNASSKPEGQNITHGIDYLCNNGTIDGDISVNLSDTPNTGWDIFVSNTSNLSISNINLTASPTTPKTIYTNLTTGVCVYFWYFSGCYNVTENPGVYESYTIT